MKPLEEVWVNGGGQAISIFPILPFAKVIIRCTTNYFKLESNDRLPLYGGKFTLQYFIPLFSYYKILTHIPGWVKALDM